MNRRISRRAVLGTAGALGAQGLFPSAGRAADAYTMRLSHSVAATSVQGMAASQFAANVERRSNGQLKIEVFPNGQLAAQQDTVEGLATGVVDFSVQSTAFLVARFPRFQIFDAPFLFKDEAAGYRVCDGPVGNDLFAELDSKGILGLCWAFSGFKQLETTTKTVLTPDDMKGIRIRSAGGQIYAATYESLGAIPIAVDMSEAFTALTQHTIDALDIILDAFSTSKFYTVLKHVAMLNHISSVGPLLGSKRKVEALPAALQRVVKEEGKGLASYWRALYARQTAAAIASLKSNGVVFNDIQYPAFRKAVEPVYTLVQSKIGADFIERVRRAAG